MSQEILSRSQALGDFEHHIMVRRETPMLCIGLADAWEYRLNTEAATLWDPDDQDVQFDPRVKWAHLDHQTAGVCCHHRGYFVVPLKVTVEASNAFAEIEGRWLNSNLGCPTTSLDDVLEYRAQLRSLLNVDCKWSYGRLEEGLYPIDWQPALVRTLLVEDVPEVSSLVVECRQDASSRWQAFYEEPDRGLGPFFIVVGANSD